MFYTQKCDVFGSKINRIVLCIIIIMMSTSSSSVSPNMPTEVNFMSFLEEAKALLGPAALLPPTAHLTEHPFLKECLDALVVPPRLPTRRSVAASNPDRNKVCVECNIEKDKNDFCKNQS